MAAAGKFKLLVLDAERKIFEGEIGSAFIQGDNGEYEILAYHYPVLGLLKQGQIVIDWKYYIDVRNGILKFFKNDCVIIVEREAL